MIMREVLLREGESGKVTVDQSELRERESEEKREDGKVEDREVGYKQWRQEKRGRGDE